MPTDTLVDRLPPTALIALDVWADGPAAIARLSAALGGTLPPSGGATALAGGWRAIRAEPALWWLCGPLDGLDDQLASVAAALDEDGAATDLSGAFVRLRVGGPDWREVLMIGGVFDAEDPAFGPGSTAGTILHHTSVRYDVTAPDAVEIYVAPSHVDDLLHHLRSAVSRLGP